VIKKSGLIGLCLSLLVLASCTGTSYIQKAKDIDGWKQQRTALEKLKQWNISGKISIRSADFLYTADLFWQQKNSHLKLRLVAPFSQDVTEFRGDDESGYKVLTGRGEYLNVDSPEVVTEHAFGVSLPFTELKSWVKGLPDKNMTVWRARFNEQNQLQSFEQSGWQVKYKRYKKVGNKTLPAKVFLTRLNESLSDHEVDVRLILRRWVL